MTFLDCKTVVFFSKVVEKSAYGRRFIVLQASNNVIFFSVSPQSHSQFGQWLQTSHLKTGCVPPKKLLQSIDFLSRILYTLRGRTNLCYCNWWFQLIKWIRLLHWVSLGREINDLDHNLQVYLTVWQTLSRFLLFPFVITVNLIIKQVLKSKTDLLKEL